MYKKQRKPLEKPCEVANDLLLALSDVEMVAREIHDDWLAFIKADPNPHECDMCKGQRR